MGKTSLHLTLPLLFLSNLCLSSLSIYCGCLQVSRIVLLAFVAGSVLSLWQLQILHEVLHSGASRLGSKLGNSILFWGSMPSAFGYWLYLKFGHLSHHRSVGSVSLAQVFESDSSTLDDGDVLFVNHRMDLNGAPGPQIQFPWKKESSLLSIGTLVFRRWKSSDYIRNVFLFYLSFLVERIMLILNDVVVALSGKNFFFPNKPSKFHSQCTLYTRGAVLIRLFLCFLGGVFNNKVFSLKPLLFLMLSETLWSLPPHPASAMFVTNHGSTLISDNDDDTHCQPTSSTYAGKWYSILTLGTNFHTEHHDFPTIPLHLLGKLRQIAGPDFYRMESNDNILQIMKETFAFPNFYACSNNIQQIQYET